MTSRRVNALEYVLIPRIEATIHYITQEMDEQSREDFPETWLGGKKPELAKLNSCINLPYIIDGEQVVTQSNTCMLYLGQKLSIALPGTWLRTTPCLTSPWTCATTS